MNYKKKKINLDFLEDLTEEFDNKLEQALTNRNNQSYLSFQKQSLFPFNGNFQKQKQQLNVCSNKLIQNNKKEFQGNHNTRNQKIQQNFGNLLDFDVEKEIQQQGEEIHKRQKEPFGFYIEMSNNINHINQSSTSEEETEIQQSDNCQNTNFNFIFSTPTKDRGSSQMLLDLE